MKKIAVCVPTYNRKDMIEELFIRCADNFKEFGFDFYIYDSSEGDETEQLTVKYRERYDNIIYRRVDPSVHANRKVYMIYEEISREDKYDYVWIFPQYARWTKDFLKRIADETELGYDMIVMSTVDLRIREEVYSDSRELFRNLACYLTKLGAALINVRRLFNKIDWNYYEQKYLVPDKINFSHTMLYLEQLSRSPDISVHFIRGLGYRESILRTDSGWFYEDPYYIWVECWYSAVMSLPICYTYADKNKVIRDSWQKSGPFTKPGMLQFRQLGIFDTKVYKKYIKQWKQYTHGKRRRCAYRISRMTPAAAEKKRYSYFANRDVRENLKKFFDSYSEIYIYGCGIQARVFLEYMNHCKIKCRGFLVSDTSTNMSEYFGIKVSVYDPKILDDPNTGIILALNIQNSNAVLNNFRDPELRKRVFSKWIYYKIIGEDGQ